MRGHPLAPVQDLHDVFRVTDLDLLADQSIGDAVVVALELDVVIDVDAGFLPASQLITDPE